jgi:murein DD-endopeptidase MepM/ murein hydrolase activator NlpD
VLNNKNSYKNQIHFQEAFGGIAEALKNPDQFAKGLLKNPWSWGMFLGLVGFVLGTVGEEGSVSKGLKSGLFSGLAGFIGGNLLNPQSASASEAPIKESSSSPEPPIDDAEGGKFSSPVPPGTIFTSPFGMRQLPGQKPRMHQGVDLGCPVGTDIKAAKGGRVVFAGFEGTPPIGKGYGYYALIEHKDSSDKYSYSLYGHLDSNHSKHGLGFLKEGQIVKRGEVIAKSGGDGRPGSGSSKGAHLHFETSAPGQRISIVGDYFDENKVKRVNPKHVCKFHPG